MLGNIPVDEKPKQPRIFLSSAARISAFETDFSKISETLLGFLAEKEIPLSSDELYQFSAGIAILEKATKTHFLKNNSESSGTIIPFQPVVNVIYKAPGDCFRFQYANPAYLHAIGKEHSSDYIIGTPVEDLMKHIYTSSTIDTFENEHSDQGWYGARFIPMDNLPKDKNGSYKTYFWYRKRFKAKDGFEFDVRIGMNGSNLTETQKIQLISLYKVIDIIRNEIQISSHTESFSPTSVIKSIRERSTNLIEKVPPYGNALNWHEMMLTISEDIFKNGPFPMTLVNQNGKILYVSTSYAGCVGYKIHEILSPGFFEKIYSGNEKKSVDSVLEYYKQHGKYPDGTSFKVMRGSSWSSEEEAYRPNIPGSIELIPDPYVIADRGIIRWNSVRPN